MSIFSDFIGSVARAGLTALSRRSLPRASGVMHAQGVNGKIEILRDRWGVPHIYAGDIHDAFFAQGLVHAQDRLWQMELNRRTAQGRLSELFGEVALDTDRTTRTFGFHRLGNADWEQASPTMRQVVEAYTAGVNAHLEHPMTWLPIEFSLLNHRPEPWKPEDTMAFSRVMLWQLSHAWYGEIVRAQLIQAVGAEHAAELEIQYPALNPITLPEGIEFNKIVEGKVIPEKGPFLQRGKGSNAWTISGKKTHSGKPILCNDMHLALQLPSIWYEVHLEAGDLQATGVSLPGVPLVLVGHNAHIAWGITLAFTDSEDLFIEQFDPQDSHNYRFGDGWRRAEVVPEEIKVKGRLEPHIEQVLVTHHGPVISDVVGYPEQRLAVNSMALRPCPAVEGWYRLDMAQGWDDFVAAMRLIEAPQLNIAYADIEGNIGYWVTGRVPVRSKGDGSLPVPGWSGEYEWIGEVPFEEMPHAFNPAKGYVVTCNHRLVPDDYPHFLGNVWMNGYRARRIVDVLESQEKHTLEEMGALHIDFTCIPGREFVRRLEGFSSQDPDAQLALTLLRGWDGQLTPASVPGSVYEVTRYTLMRNLLDPALGVELTIRYMGVGFHPLLLHSHEFYGHDTTVLLRLLDAPDSWWVQQAGGREAWLSRSLKEAVGWLRTTLGPDPGKWEWGRLHTLTFRHPLSVQAPLDRVFNRGPYPIGGDTDTPCQTATNPEKPYENNAWAPSYRQIIDLADFSRSVAIYPPGQSGQLGSSHYDDLIDLWLKGEYHPMLWTRSQVEECLENKLVVSPLEKERD